MKRHLRALTAAVLLVGLPVGTALAGAPTVGIDKDGCESSNGYNQVNRCNSQARTDGKTFGITHSDSEFKGSGTASSAFVSLFCSFGYAVYRGGITPGQKFACDDGDADYAQRSVCGANSACGAKD